MIGCGPSFDPPTLVNDVRLLAVRADPPEIAGGEMATLEALHHPPTGITLAWAYCTLRPTAAALVNTDCIQNDAAPYLVALGSGDKVTITMPMTMLAQLGLPDYTGGFYLPVRVRATGQVGGNPMKTDVGIYRLRIHVPELPLPANHNPQLQGLYLPAGDGGDPGMALAEGVDLAMKKGEQIRLRAVFAPGSAETYPQLEGDPRAMQVKMVSETLEVRWYASAGTWQHESTGPDEDVLFTLADDKNLPAPQAKIDVYAVARDERGGTDWLHRTIVYQP